MKLLNSVFIGLCCVLFSGCTQKTDDSIKTEVEPAAAETQAADEASLLAAAKEAGVSDADALAAKAEIDKIYDETSAKMDVAEAERIARDKQFKDEACIENCGEE